MALFPITDPSRTADIRMRRRRALFLLAAMVVLPAWLLSGHDRPASHHHKSDIDLSGRDISTALEAALGSLATSAGHHRRSVGSDDVGPPNFGPQTVSAAALQITGNCDTALTIIPKNGLSGHVEIYARRALSNLQGGDGRTLALSSCGEDALYIAIPASMPLSLDRGGGGNVTIGSLHGDVTIGFHGDGNLTVGALHDLVLNSGGSGNVRIGMIDGHADMTRTGSGDLTVGEAHGPVQLDTRDSGDVSLGVVSAPLVLKGRSSGNIEIGTLSGPARFDVGGDSNLTVGLVHTSDLGLAMTGSGSLKIGAGEIGQLDVTLGGSVDGEIGATVGSARQQIGSEATLTLKHGANDTRAPLPPLPPLAPLPPLPPG